MTQTFILPVSVSRDGQITRIAAVLGSLAKDKAWQLELKEHKRKRSDNQNRYLWSAVYPAITRILEGFDSEDVHEWMLGEHFGWEVVELFGKKRQRPIRRSSKLSKLEFRDYIDFVQRKAAEFGIYIPSPNEVGYG